MSVAVHWTTYDDTALARGMWDQAMLEELLTGELWLPARTPRYEHRGHVTDVQTGEGAIVVVPGRFNVNAIDRLNVDLAPLPWVLLIVTSDEERWMNWRAVAHPNMAVLIMTPHPDKDGGADGYLGEGWQPGTRQFLATLGDEASGRPNAWFFAGQITHERRRAAASAMRHMPDGRMVGTASFTAGLAQHDYLTELASAKTAPCPSGPATPDSFRLYEALEAGCIPVADGLCPSYGERGYWPLVLGDDPPFPVIENWSTLPAITRGLAAGWPTNANRVGAWWAAHKRDLAYKIDDTVRQLSGKDFLDGESIADRITVIIPTSPIPSHPDTKILRETLASVRDQPGFADAEVIIVCDGVRAEQESRRADYDEYVRRIVWACHHEWHNVLPVVNGEHLHQALGVRRALDLIRTPYLLFVEHDTPLCGEIAWENLCAAIETGSANLIRFNHEARVLQVHAHLALDKQPQDICGAPLIRTIQWSQRPHLASTDYYRRVIGSHFGAESRTMIEDAMHGVLMEAWRRRGLSGWREHRVWIYAPDGDMKRSLHLDGRGDDPKFEMIYAYDGATPTGAPAPTKERVD